MKVPFTWKPTGWFIIGWSADFPLGESRPLKYFGRDLVAYRDESGSLHVLDAHCPHLGAHLGHGGKVKGDCITCPYHGWGFGPDGVNKFIPYEDRPNVSHGLRSYTILEQDECVFMWHDPKDGPPRWELPSVFSFRKGFEADPKDFYRAYPEMSIKYENEPVHPQITLENSPDSVHFEHVHNATVTPKLINWHIEDQQYWALNGWPVPNAPGDGMALKLCAVSCGVAGSFGMFEGSFGYRLMFFTTPIDNERSDLFYSVYWPREPGDTNDTPPEKIVKRAQAEALSTLIADLEIWRYQIYIENPSFAQQDARPYGALRKWAKQFYEIGPDE